MFAGEDKANKKDNGKKDCCDKMQMQDCKSLCFAGPHLECDYDIEVMAAAIYEQVAVQGGEVAAFTSSRTQFNYLQGGVGIEPIETISWGFKVGLGWKTGHDDWKLAARYTWFHALTESTLQTANGGGGVFPNLYSINLLTVVSGGSAPSFQNYQAGNNTFINTLNVYMIRPTLYTALLEVSPYFGIDFADLRRRETVIFTNENPTPVIYTGGGYYRAYDNNAFWGVGPMVGLATNWYVGYDFSIYADAYLALTYGQAQSYSQDFSYALVSVGNYKATDSNVKNTLNQFSPETNMQLGFAWMHNFEDDRMAVGFKIGYEAAYYFQAFKNILNQSGYLVMGGNGIGIQGLVLEGQLDF